LRPFPSPFPNPALPAYDRIHQAGEEPSENAPFDPLLDRPGAALNGAQIAKPTRQGIEKRTHKLSLFCGTLKSQIVVE
jgi:hypothetical protein